MGHCEEEELMLDEDGLTLGAEALSLGNAAEGKKGANATCLDNQCIFQVIIVFALASQLPAWSPQQRTAWFPLPEQISASRAQLGNLSFRNSAIVNSATQLPD